MALDRIAYLTRTLFGPAAVLRLESGVFYAGTTTHRLQSATLSELLALLERHARDSFESAKLTTGEFNEP